MSIRNLMFDRGILSRYRVDVPVVSVGNISAGGTGKTPMTEFIAARLKGRGLRVAVLSRGYGRASSGYQVVSNGHQVCAELQSAGDEAALLAENLTGVIVAVDENRVRGAKRLVSEFGPEVIILDDGFQHRWLDRTIDLVLVRPDDILGNPRVLPAGYLRESLKGLQRADCIAIVGARDGAKYQATVSAVERITGKPVIGFSLRPRRLVRLVTGGAVHPEEVDGPCAAVSGIARPESFEQTLRELGMNVVRHTVFPDHYWYRPRDLRTLHSTARAAGAQWLVTTRKDAVRLASLEGLRDLDREVPFLVLEVSVAIDHGEEMLNQLLEQGTCR
ncbi:MAG: tetraacyldisaccharide 4'-kinase [Bacteroidia bacterium]|nr:MAG: tetraacyldisaccharide 4'-kinase [Bacteroidia bacterium]